MNPAATPPRITIERAGQHAGETVVIPGWLYNLRKSGKIAFPILRDGTGHHAVRGRQEPVARERCSRRSRT